MDTNSSILPNPVTVFFAKFGVEPSPVLSAVFDQAISSLPLKGSFQSGNSVLSSTSLLIATTDIAGNTLSESPLVY